MDERESQKQATRIETLIQEVVTVPDRQVRDKIEELLHELLDMYGTGLARIVEMTTRTEQAGPTLLQTFAEDELVGSLLLLHGLHPVELEQRVRQAVERLQPSIQAHKGTLALLHVTDKTATLSLQVAGGCQGCGTSTQALKRTIENAIYGAAPDLDEIRIEEAAPGGRSIAPVKFIPPSKRRELAAAQKLAAAQASADKGQANVSRTR